MRRALLSLVGSVLVGSSALPAQAPQSGRPVQGPQLPAGRGEVRGQVVDAASGAVVPRASITVRTKASAAIAAGAIAGPDGAFRVQGLRAGTYVVRATFLGFGPLVQEVTLTDAAPAVDIGTIKLSRVAVQLSGVAIQEERDAVSVEPDRNSYRAKAVAPAATNASEVLDAVPSVQVDGDGKVSLRGNENVAVQINGRPTPITGAQLASYLKSLPANIVERVEVVPNPSARYDPEGMAGIINIVLKQNTDLGLSTSLMLGAAQTDRYNASANVGYQVGRFSSMTNLGFNKDVRNVAGTNDRERLDALRAAVFITEQDIDGVQDNAGQNFTTSVDWKLNARDVLSNAVSVNHRDGSDASAAAYSELTGAGALTDRYDRLRTTDSRGTMFDYTAAFKRSFAPRTHELSTELRVNRSHDEEESTLWRHPGGGTASRLEGEINETDSRIRNLRAQLDYVRPLGKKAKLETGYLGTDRQLDRDFDVRKDLLGSGTWTPSNLSNALDFSEQVHAVYGVVSNSRGRVDLQAGVRAEYAEREVALAGEQYPFAYRSLYPSGVVTFNATPRTQLKASYSRRVRRPGSQELNPFPSFFDTHNVFF
ncbi:MAG TPA: TonB-dependent receptor, partial [Gemmatimonadaceae bacterium]|nr:TonB-dependent receptor [Gemmatimonadaceae bacterium]